MSLNDKAYTVYTVEKLKKRRLRRIALWAVTGLVVLVLAIIGGSYLWLSCQVGGTKSTNSSLESVLGSAPEDAIDSPTGMDILVLGCDRHPDDSGEDTRSDTLILVHADPDENYLSMLSLPRDLRVEIPGHGEDKLNAAYALGGEELAIQTVEQLTNIDITEYVEVDFHAFSDMTDALGGVYVDVDRRYYNDDADSDYELIKISPGYQRLNGDDALDYVRFRHDLNYDFGRMDRQQRFLTALREQAMGWNLVLDLPGLVDALFDNLVTTLDTNDIIRLAYWGAAKLSGDRIRQVSITGDVQTIDDKSFVIAAEGTVEEAVTELLTPPGDGEAGGSSSTAESSTTTTTAVDTSQFTTNVDAIENSRLWKQFAAAAPFVVRAPGYLPEGYAYMDSNPDRRNPGTYDIEGGDGAKPAIKMVYRLTRQGEEADQYMGIMQTTWLDAPAAAEGREVTRDGITYTVVGTSQSIDHVWWIQDEVLYWVSNTLSYYLSSAELLKVAQSMIVVPSGESD
jgi:LCP family protein required for cell wall assembly